MKRLLEAAQARFRRARPGSVLIMVVSLLVLLALIGTAAISTARIDRGSSRAHVGNTQADILLQSVKDITIGRIQDDAYPDNIDSPGTSAEEVGAGEAWMASRLPERLWPFNEDSGTPDAPRWYNTSNPNPIVWRYISYPPFANGSAYLHNPPNEDTNGSPGRFRLHLPKGTGFYSASGLPRPVTGTAWEPTFVQLASGAIMPGLRPIALWTDTSNKSIPVLASTGSDSFLAADADGDGIADSLLWKLPGTPIDGPAQN